MFPSGSEAIGVACWLTRDGELTCVALEIGAEAFTDSPTPGTSGAPQLGDKHTLRAMLTGQPEPNPAVRPGDRVLEVSGRGTAVCKNPRTPKGRPCGTDLFLLEDSPDGVPVLRFVPEGPPAPGSAGATIYCQGRVDAAYGVWRPHLGRSLSTVYEQGWREVNDSVDRAPRGMPPRRAARNPTKRPGAYHPGVDPRVGLTERVRNPVIGPLVGAVTLGAIAYVSWWALCRPRSYTESRNTPGVLTEIEVRDDGCFSAGPRYEATVTLTPAFGAPMRVTRKIDDRDELFDFIYGDDTTAPG